MFKKYFIAGLLVWVPLLATIVVIRFMVDFFDKTLNFIPTAYRPETLIGYSIPGLGLLLTLILVFVTGVIVTNFLGHKIVALWERVLARIPLVRSIYNAVKQVMHTIFATQGDAFRQVLLVEYPRKDLWSIAFQTSRGFKKAEEKSGEKLITIFVPTTPNPTSGFLMLIPEQDAIPLDMSVDEALKMVVSLGIVLPEQITP